MVRAKKSLGQNFLVDANTQRRIAAALEAEPGDTVLEIGPGTGALTRHLAGTVRSLVVIELDDALAAALQREMTGRDDVRVIHADALKQRLEDLTDDVAALRVIGNIPYNITTPLIFWLLERRPRPQCIVLMIQREVADRILAEPGGREYGALSVGVRTLADAERLFHVPRGAFRPVPDVDSSVIRITPHAPPRLSEGEERDVRALARAAFAWRRKQLRRILRDARRYELDDVALADIERTTGFALERRPETLAPDEFVALARALRSAGFPAREAA